MAGKVCDATTIMVLARAFVAGLRCRGNLPREREQQVVLEVDEGRECLGAKPLMRRRKQRQKWSPLL